MEIDADVDHFLEPPSVDDALGISPGARERSKARFFMASSGVRVRTSSSPDVYAAASIVITSSRWSVGSASALAIDSALM
jgi:hypothetical protein